MALLENSYGTSFHALDSDALETNGRSASSETLADFRKLRENDVHTWSGRVTFLVFHIFFAENIRREPLFLHHTLFFAIFGGRQ